jgi:hypothetical protein
MVAQKIELIQGIHVNKFFNTDNQPHFITRYTPYTGYTFRFAYQSPKVKKMSWRLALGYQKYSNDFTASDGGNGGGGRFKQKLRSLLFRLPYTP